MADIGHDSEPVRLANDCHAKFAESARNRTRIVEVTAFGGLRNVLPGPATGDENYCSCYEAGGVISHEARIFLWLQESNIVTMRYGPASSADCAGHEQEE